MGERCYVNRGVSLSRNTGVTNAKCIINYAESEVGRFKIALRDNERSPLKLLPRSFHINMNV